jgi:hypothetical protein
LHEALHQLEDVDGTNAAVHAVVDDNPVQIDGTLAFDDRAAALNFEAGHAIASLGDGLRSALERRYGPNLSPRELELIVSGVELAALAIQRWTTLDGGPRWEDPRDELGGG